MTHLFVGLGALALAAYAIVVAVLWMSQERIVFQPPRAAPAPVAAQRFDFRTADGIESFAYVVGDCAARSTVLLAFHGNAELARWLVPWATDAARELDACVVLPEFRGYDGVAGRPTYEGSRLDAQAALTLVRDTLHVPQERLVYFGHSLGTAIATELASDNRPRALVLQAPFSSARAMAERMIVPGLSLLWTLITRVHYDTVARVRTLAVPVWVVQGDRDLVVPVRMGREVFAAAAHPGELLIVPGAGHGNVAALGGAAYWSWFRRAVRGAPDPNRDRTAILSRARDR